MDLALEPPGNRPAIRPDEPLSPAVEILRRNLKMRLLRMACRSGNREQILLAITPIVIDDLIDRLTATPRHERDSLRLKDGFPSCRGDGDLG